LLYAAGGALKAIKTTPLITVEEAMEALRKAAGVGDRAAMATVEQLSGRARSPVSLV